MNGDDIKGLAALAGAILLLAFLDWTFSFGPLSWNAVRRCTNALEGTTRVESKPHYNIATGQIEITGGLSWSHEAANDFCWDRKRDGRLNLSGGSSNTL
jgi:hypothetical protein